MEITINYLREKFNEYNTMFFEGKLPNCLIQITNTKRRLGVFIYNRQSGGRVIRISRYDGLRKEIAIQTTLIHEMIHLWQNVNYGKSDHKQTFKAMSAKIYQLSSGKYNIKRLSDADLETDAIDVVNVRKTNITPFKVFLVYHKDSGKYWLVSSASTKVTAIRNYFLARPNEWTLTREWFSTDSKLDSLVKNRQTHRIKGKCLNNQEVAMYISR